MTKPLCQTQCPETICFVERVRYHCQLRDGHDGYHVHFILPDEDIEAFGDTTVSTGCKIQWSGEKHWQRFLGKKMKSTTR